MIQPEISKDPFYVLLAPKYIGFNGTVSDKKQCDKLIQILQAMRPHLPDERSAESENARHE